MNRKKAVEDAYLLMGIPKIPKMKPFRWDKRKCVHWARQARQKTSKK